MWPLAMTTSSRSPLVSGSRSMALRSRPVMQAATAIAMLAEVQLVTQPASAPVAAAMALLAARCSSAISTDRGRMPAMARATSGDTGLAPNTVSVPEMLISGVSPSSAITSSHGMASLHRHPDESRDPLLRHRDVGQMDPGFRRDDEEAGIGGELANIWLIRLLLSSVPPAGRRATLHEDHPRRS